MSSNASDEGPQRQHGNTREFLQERIRGDQRERAEEHFRSFVTAGLANRDREDRHDRTLTGRPAGGGLIDT